MTNLASKQPTRWGGECYASHCPFHWKHEPLCDAESFVITEEDFQKRALCKQAQSTKHSKELEEL